MASLKENYHQLKADFVNFKRTLGLVLALPSFFRETITLQQAETGIKKLLDTRVERFLELVRSEVYEEPESPYLRLLKHAGCQFSDLENSTKRHGVESTLAKLAGEGVFFTSDEFKGKTEVVRGRLSFYVSPNDFERRESSAGFTTQSSGTRNVPIKSFNSLKWRSLQTLGDAIFYQAHDLISCAHAVYEPVIAGRNYFMLINAKLGIPTNRWFALKVPVHSAPEDRYHYLN
ncbi:MAG: hypothetical protein OEN50_12925, partial [Deltaproteobacteria bacterium]|nr:hypothetical protein [Deltaproteobacteria bacterium]